MGDVYPEAFERCWKAYPARQPDNPKKPAHKAWAARIREGVTADELHAATERYAAVMRRKGNVGTEFVMMASTFYGPNERWKGFLPKPEQPPAAPVRQKPQEPEERATPEQHAAFREMLAKLTSGKAMR